MQNPFVSRVGGILSADIAVPEHEREVRFYSRVLGTGEVPLWGENLVNNHGVPILGLGARAPEHGDLPLEWMPHIQVADVGASVERALALGGHEVMHGKDGNGNSQWAVLRDPSGAAFGLVPVVAVDQLPPAPQETTPVGRIAWCDLTVSDAQSIRDFYREVIGWSVQDVAMTDDGASYADYAMLGGDGEAAAGVCHARGGNADLPSVWMLYLPVGDLAESLRRVEEEGGQVITSRAETDGGHVFAVVRDPVGVCFALLPG